MKHSFWMVAKLYRIAYNTGMSTVLCVVDHTPSSGDAVRRAIARSRDRGAELALVGVVQPFADAAGPAYGERVRRLGLVETNLVRAARAARAAGVAPIVERRFGHTLSEAVAAADEVGADEVVLAEPRGLFRSRAEVVTIARPQPERPRLALVA